MNELFFAILQRKDFKEYINLISLSKMTQLRLIEAPTKDCQHVTFINSDRLLGLLDSLVHSVFYITSLNGVILKKIDHSKDSSFIKSLYVSSDSSESCLLKSDGLIHVINNLNLKEMAAIDVKQLIFESKPERFYMEENNERAMEIGVKRRSLTQDSSFVSGLRSNPMGFEFPWIFSMTPDNRYCAVVFFRLKKRLFIIDLSTEELCCSILFLSAIKQVVWFRKRNLAICCGKHLVYFWSPQTFNIAEKFYTNQVFFSSIRVSQDDRFLAFADEKNKKMCVLQFESF